MARKTWVTLLAQFADNDVGAIDAEHIRDLVDSLSAHAEARPPEHTDNQTSGFDVGHTWIDTSASPWPQAWRCVASDTVTGIWARIEGPPGTPGGPGLIPMGIWDDETTYPPTALVRHGTALWVTNTENTNATPGVAPEWDLFIEDGPPGPPGGGAEAFVELADVPGSFAGAAGLAPVVAGDESGLVFLGFAAIVNHGANASVVRPTALLVIWRGSVQPTNMLNGDIWIETGDFD